MTAPLIVINGGAPGVKAAIAATTSFSATLDDTSGVRTVEWSILSTDETSEVGDYTLTPSGAVGQTVTTTSLGAGTAALLHVRINGGIDSQTGNADPTTTEATGKFGVLLSSGAWVGAAGEETEHDATYGATEILNGGVRAVAAGPSSTAAYLENATVALNTNGVPIQLTPATLRFIGASTIEPLAAAYNRAAGAIGTGLVIEREILSGTVDTSTSVQLDFRVRGVTTSTKRTFLRILPVLTAISGDNLTSDATFYLLNASTTPTLKFTIKADGTLVATGKLTGLTAGTATGHAVEYDQLNTALGGYVVTSRTITAGAGLTGGGDLSGNRTIDIAAADSTITINADSIQVATGGITNTQVNAAAAIDGTKISPDFGSQNVTTTGTVTTSRVISSPSTPASSGAAVTFDLSAKQNVHHTTTENTTVTISGAADGVAGKIIVSQGAAGKTLTMPTNGVGVEYDNAIIALGVGAIIDTTALTRTLLEYQGLPNGKAYIHARSVCTIP